MILHRDYETKSCADLRKVGAFAYAQHPSTDVLVACFIIEEEGKDPQKFDWFPGEELPAPVARALVSAERVCGHNSQFEQCIDREIMGPRYGWPIPRLEQLDCTMARCAVLSLPLDLARAAAALKLAYQKDAAGHRLMLQMCKPRKVHDDGTVTWWDQDAKTGREKVLRLRDYCMDDVRAETGLDKALRPMDPLERPVWLLDQIVNNRGVQIDLDFVKTAESFADRQLKRLNARMKAVTGGAVEKATQLDRLKEWVKAAGVELKIETKTRRNGDEYEAEVADREAIQDLLDGELPNDAVREALQTRLDAGKSSTKKLAKFRSQACADGRARGNLQYHAAGPGRWAGRGIQLQNLPRKGVSEPGGWDAALRDMRELGDDTFDLVWGAGLDVVSRMLRGAVIAAPGNKLVFGDYSSVEARGCVWAGRQIDQVELFASGGKIYEAAGAAIFNITIDEVIAGHESGENIMPRICGKGTVLGCGYGMGPPKFRAQTKKQSGIILPEGLEYTAVYGWREANRGVVELWRELEDAARNAIEAPGRTFWAGPFAYRVHGRWLQCRLPSGRIIWYRRPSLKPATADLEQLDEGETLPRWKWKIHYWGVNGVTKQWEEETTWGGKLLENCIQGMCRDFLAGSILKLEAAGWTIVLTVHDEAISEVPLDFDGRGLGKLPKDHEFLKIMTELPPWATWRGLVFPLKAEGSSGLRYAK